MTMLDHALAWAAKGFRVFPLRPNGKRPAMEGWRHLATTDEAVIRKVWASSPYNIGVLCSDMIVVDVDVKHGHNGIASYLDLELPLDTLCVRTPTGGLHYYLGGPNTRNRAGLADGIDVRSLNGYVVAPGSVTPDGAYSVENDAPLLPAPEEFVALVGAPRERKESAADIELDTPGAVERAQTWLSNDAPEAVLGQSGDHTTYAVACKVRDFGVSEESCYDLMLDHWNDRCSPQWEPDELRVKVENAYNYAENPAGVLTPEAEFGSIDLPEPETKPRQRSKWMWAGDDLDLDFDWLYYNRLPRRGTAILVGPSNSGKSFFAFALAKSLADGSAFYGVEPDEKCGTLILAGEGVSGLSVRLSTLKGLPIAALPVPALNTAETVKGVFEDITEAATAMRERFGVRLGLIVVETLAAARLVDDENDNGQCAQAVRNLEAWAMAFNCLVVVTHHPPKNGTGTRGGGALHAGVDTVVEIERPGEGEVRYVSCTKGRDTPTGKWGSFTLIPRTVGFDSKGREITTCDLSTGMEAKPGGGQKPKHFDKFLMAVEFARTDNKLEPGAPVPRPMVRDAFKGLVDLKPSSITESFDKCRDWGARNFVLSVEMVNGDETICEGRGPMVPPGAS